ncbi:MAG: metal ABC transporter substrate-binding protein [Planctomycetes bacterium]|nr:metal ABC transporter substrate-binding protein [Planctomycetota bacterium]
MLSTAFRALITLALCAATTWSQAEKLHCVTTIPDLADFVREIGGDEVTVESLATGAEDLHNVPVRPTFLVRLQRADVFFQLGLDAEEAWVPALLEQCRNPRIQPGKPGFVNGAWKITPLEVPDSLNRSLGNLHPRGNPHFNIDPLRGRQLVINVATGLIRVRPEKEDYFKQRFAAYSAKLKAKIEEWAELAKPLKGKELITFHRDLSYLADRYGFVVVGTVEPRVGIPPTGPHVARLIELMKERQVKVVAAGHYYAARMPGSIAEETGCKVVTTSLYVNGVPEASSYLAMVDYNLKTLLRAFDLPTELPPKEAASKKDGE